MKWVILFLTAAKATGMTIRVVRIERTPSGRAIALIFAVVEAYAAYWLYFNSGLFDV